MKVAFATQDQQRVDAHFGWARHLAVYQIVSPTELLLRARTSAFGEDLAEDGNEDKLAPKLAGHRRLRHRLRRRHRRLGGGARGGNSKHPPGEGDAARAHPGHPGQAAGHAGSRARRRPGCARR